MSKNTNPVGDPVDWYRRMRLVRGFETHAAALVDEGDINGPVHEYTGQEAVAVGVCAALRTDDVITSTHRGHGHILAKGGDPARMFAELLGRETGYNRGRGGSMHIADLALGIFGANGIVGAGAPMACGAAHAFKARREARVAVPFFGDGAMNQGVLLESFNLAAIGELPVVFVCENNQMAITSPIAEMTRGELTARAEGFGLRAEAVDGMDVRAVYAAASAAVEHARSGLGPTFLECRAYRFSVHNIAAGAGRHEVRSPEMLDEARKLDPIERLATELTRDGHWLAGARSAIDDEIEAELEGCIGFARNSRRPDADTALDYMYAVTYPDFPAKGWER
ncbi:MAG: thiamine pyrophosphate-dependent dehydrogenase E1 component subunit alpha [Gammaproteobacteria bacterium]